MPKNSFKNWFRALLLHVFIKNTIYKTLNNERYTFTEKIISTENKIPLKLRKFILKYKFSDNNIEFILYIIRYSYQYTKLKIKL